MELSNFLQLINRQKFILIGIPLFALLLTFFLVRKLPDTYTSQGRLATGLIDQSQQELINNNQTNSDDNKISQQFSNLIQMMQLKKIYDQVSYQLIIHDLTDDSPYHKPSKLMKDLSKDAKKHALDVFTKKYKQREPLSLWDADEKGLNELIVSMGYDEPKLKNKMVIYRANNSDFIDIEFESDSPLLSAFVINALCNEFIVYYSSLVRENQLKAVNFLDSLMKEKRSAMNGQMQDLKNYKIINRVLNLNEQAKSLYGQIADFETRKEITDKDILAYTGALKSIEEKFNPQDRKYLESTLTKINQEIVATKESLKQVSQDYIKSNYDVKYKRQIDSLQTVLSSQINQSTDKYILNPLAAKESLVLQKLNLEVQLDLAKNSVGTLNNEMIRLNQKFDKLVPHEAVIQSYETEIDIASKEYIEILKKFNQTSLESSFSVRLRQIELAMPGDAQPSKKMLIVILSGMLSFVFCMVVMFILFYLDDSIHVPKELADKTNLPVLGYLPFIKTSVVDLQHVWNEDSDKKKIEFRNLLRSARFEIENEMKNEKILLLTSLKPFEGKTITALSLAYAYSAINKKVLLIDGNFADPSITSATHTKLFLEDYLNNKISLNEIKNEDKIIALGTKGGDVSLLELSDENTIREKLKALESVFDIIIIEMASLDTLNRAKEWIAFGNKLVAVFEANQTINLAKKEEVNYLTGLDNKFIGWVMNKVGSRKSAGQNRSWFRKNN